MTNSWSFLFDELNMSNQNHLNDKSSIDSSPDTIDFSSPHILGGMSNDHITITGDEINSTSAESLPFNYFGSMSEDTITFTDPRMVPSTNTKQKYSEDEIIKELKEYIGRTYQQHYSAGYDKIQTLDLIEACGDGEAFCRSNILKYASRYDKKGTARRDIMKILHYAVLLMHFNDKNAQRETYPQ